MHGKEAVTRRWLGVFAALVFFGLLIWLSDRVTMQGERTIYAVNCQDGSWQGSVCTGRLVIGERYAFRASPRRHEVIYWIRGSEAPSGIYNDCTVVDRDNWSCNVRVDQRPTIAYQMANGRPTPGVQGITLPFHDVPKWKWWLIRWGFPFFSDTGDQT